VPAQTATQPKLRSSCFREGEEQTFHSEAMPFGNCKWQISNSKIWNLKSAI
jgi:hypothetical protein